MTIYYNKVVDEYKKTIFEIFQDIDYYFNYQEASLFCYDKNYKELYPITILNYIKNCK